MPNSLPTLYQDFIHLSRYARWLDKEGTRESWGQTVDRYVDYMCDIQCKDKIGAVTKKEIRDAIFELHVMPSMRCMMTAGKALTRDNVAAFNCLAGETLVTTLEEGITPIENLVAKTVHVVDGSGNWVKAGCRGFGTKKIWEVSLATSGRGEDWTLRCTGNHDWMLRDGSRRRTENLKPGDQLAFVSVPERDSVDTTSQDYRDGIIHGLVYGDGTANYGQKKDRRMCKGFVIRLCGDHEDLLQYFDGKPVSYPESFEGEPIVYLMGNNAVLDLKSLPDMDSGFFTPEYVLGFLRGWLAADGSVGKSGQVTMCTGQDGLQWIYKNAVPHGFVPRRHYRLADETNFGVRKQAEFCVEFDRRYLTKNDILIKRKRDRFNEIDKSKNPGFGKVSAVSQTDKEDVVYCFDVPTTHSFLLTRNLLTGNCSYLPIDNIKAFDEMLYLLMCGSGVGFSVERQFIKTDRMPVIPDSVRPSKTVIGVEDSKIGWANAYRELMSMLYQGRVPKWDTKDVRPSGARLKTFGGRASGPEPLEDLFRFCVETFTNAAGRRLTSIECHDICCKIGEVVVVGGVRRSALLSLSNPSDDRMRFAKSGNWSEITPWRRMANNSACYTEKPGMDVFIREWTSLYESKSGERGFFNRAAAKAKATQYGRRSADFEYGCNPCSEILLRPNQFCVSGNTPLATTERLYPRISEIEGREVKVWNGREWTPVTVRKTGEGQNLVRVHISDGSYLDCTPDHRWSVKDRFKKEWQEVQAKDLMTFSKYAVQVEPANAVNVTGDGDKLPEAYTLGFAAGDGCVYNGSVLIDLYGPKDWDCPISGTRQKPQMNHAGTSIYVRSVASVDAEKVVALKGSADAWYDILGSIRSIDLLDFVAGLADADGSETGTGGIRIYVGEYEKGRALQLLLARIGTRCSVNLHQEAGVETNLCVRQTDSYYVQITDCSHIPCHRLDTSGGHEPKFKGKYQVIRYVEELDGLHDTYCFNEPKRHKAMFGNVLTYQCNLTEVVVREHDTVEDIKAKIRIAVILGTMQASLTKFRYIGPEWKNNTEEEALLGVSLTGVMDNELFSGRKGLPELATALSELRQYSVHVNKEWAKKIGVNPAGAITCNKPSGTVSQLVDCSSGIHGRESRHYIRNVRADKKDPMAQMMVAIGFPHEDDVSRPEHNLVFGFPVESPAHAVLKDEMTAIEQLEIWKVYQDHWCEHKPSCTVSVRENEWMDVGAWVYKNFNDVSGLTFFPHSGHTYRQAPYQSCSEKEYKDAVKVMPKEVDWTKLKEYEVDDSSVHYGELSCAAGADSCEVVDLVQKK